MATKAKVIQDKPGKGAWIDALHDGIGQFISVETLDGSMREGRLSAVRERVMVVNKSRVHIPTEIELNGDPTDLVDISRISRMDLR